jgi:hypothetical protein
MVARARIRLDLNGAAINRLGLDEARRRVAEMTRATFNRANVLTPVDTGRLRVGNNMRLWSAGSIAYGEVFNQVDYAAAVHDGAKPHIIRPRSRRALKFVVDGRTVFASSVQHPGNRPQPWLRTAMVQTAPRFGFTVINL